SAECGVRSAEYKTGQIYREKRTKRRWPMMPMTGGRSRLGMVLAAVKGQPRNGTSQENMRIGDSNDLAVMKLISGPTPIPCLRKDAAIGNTIYGPPGMSSPISQPRTIP